MRLVKKAFTLVELMIVIAIIGVLASLLLPMVTGAQSATLKAKSKTMFSSISSGLTRYKDEYGFFPTFLAEKTRVNLDDGKNSENMIKVLTGRNPDGSALSSQDRMSFNKNKTRYVDLTDENVVERKDPKTNVNAWKIVDSFGNPNIYICVDGDGDGLIKTGFPTTLDGVEASELSSLIKNQKVGIRAPVIIFTLKKDSMKANADFSSENIFSWQ